MNLLGGPNGVIRESQFLDMCHMPSPKSTDDLITFSPDINLRMAKNKTMLKPGQVAKSGEGHACFF